MLIHIIQKNRSDALCHHKLDVLLCPLPLLFITNDIEAVGVEVQRSPTHSRNLPLRLAARPHEEGGIVVSDGQELAVPTVPPLRTLPLRTLHASRVAIPTFTAITIPTLAFVTMSFAASFALSLPAARVGVVIADLIGLLGIGDAFPHHRLCIATVVQSAKDHDWRLILGTILGALDETKCVSLLLDGPNGLAPSPREVANGRSGYHGQGDVIAPLVVHFHVLPDPLEHNPTEVLPCQSPLIPQAAEKGEVPDILHDASRGPCKLLSSRTAFPRSIAVLLVAESNCLSRKALLLRFRRTETLGEEARLLHLNRRHHLQLCTAPRSVRTEDCQTLCARGVDGRRRVLGVHV
mmetsp:Transcript_64190/g.139635  ORF Transcript_64190/g.139635 Transcript_64190/m.139635 type:complete len:350 (+) Transcript_64190:1449-2498(+)